MAEQIRPALRPTRKQVDVFLALMVQVVGQVAKNVPETGTIR